MSKASGLSLTQIRAFCALAQYRSFKLSAERLGVSQSALIAQISELENIYETRLFIRQRGNNRLTDAGLSILPYCKEALHQANEARLILLAHGQVQTGELNIVAVSPYRISHLIKKFRQLYPNIKLKVSFTGSERAQQLVAAGEVDAAFCVQEGRVAGQQAIFFYRYELVAILHKDNPVLEKEVLTLQDFVGQQVIIREAGSLTRKLLLQALDAEGVVIRSDIELGSRESIREAVAQGLGVSVVAEDEHVPHRNIEVRRIRSEQLRAESSLIVLNERVSSPLVSALINVVRQHAETPFLGPA